jgi:hypothetical protein
MSTPQRQNDRFEGYIPVAARVVKFYEDHPEGRILTAIVEHDHASGFILMRAEVYRNSDDQLPAATGHAFEIQGEGFVNKTSHIENCETGSVGRALANLGYEVKEAQRPQETQKTTRPQAVSRLAEREEKPNGARYDVDILAALDALGKKPNSPWLDDQIKRKYPDHEGAWHKLSPERKGELASALKAMVDQKIAEAR